MNSRNCLVLVLLATLGFALGSSSVGAQCTPTGPNDDCNGNLISDSCDLTFGVSDDCNLNGIPDECDIAAGAPDCNLDGIPDECEPVPEAIINAPVAAGSPEDFGTYVDIDGDRAIIGDPGFESSGASPISHGSASVYKRVGTQWVLELQLVPNDIAPEQLFGTSVAIDGDLAVVGAPGSGTVSNPNKGAVYVFRKIGGNWQQEAKLTASDGMAGDSLGISVAVENNVVIGGAWKAQGSSAITTGAAYVYSFNGAVWTQDAKLFDPSPLPTTNARFGTSIALEGNWLAIGARREGASDTGAVYSYFFTLGTGWNFLQKISAPIPESGSHFGQSVALNGDGSRLLVGAPRAASMEGLAYLFDRTGSTFSPTQTLSVVGTGSNDHFGQAVGFAEDYMVVTADRASNSTGAAYVFDPSGVVQLPALVGSGSVDGSHFGFAGSADGPYALIGAPDENRAYVYQVVPFPDCNENGSDDICEITTGVVEDCNGNIIPDSCDIAEGLESDCNENGIPDSCELADGSALDCNLNGVLDECDLASGAPDCNTNNIPDDCESDCNENDIPDDCDITSGYSLDCNDNDLPDECDIAYGFALDCNLNGVPDACDLTAATSLDCNGNSIPDECDIESGSSPDCNANSIPDECDFTSGFSLDCNSNGIPDSCDIATSLSQDCDTDGIPDECELSTGTGLDCNSNGVLDNCDIATGTSQDCNNNGTPDECDISSGASLDCNENNIPDDCETNADPNPPTILGNPGDMTVSAAAGTCQAIVSWTMLTAEDDCGIAFFSGSHAPGSSFPVGSTTVTYNATDVSGNTASTSFTITVTDDEDPIFLDQLDDQTLDSESGLCSAAATWLPPSAADNCQTVTLTSTHSSGDQFPVGTSTVVYTATDAALNTATMTFTVTVIDVEPPALDGVPPGITQANDPGNCSAVVNWIEPTASDNCDTVTLGSTHNPGDTFPVGTTTVTYTAIDAAGLTTEQSFDVTVNDEENPVITGTSSPLTVENDLGACGAVVTYDAAAATDNCPGVTLDSLPASGSFFELGTTTVTVTATDTAGNTSEQTFTVTVEDTEPPTITSTSVDLTAENDPGECGAIVTYDAATATDNCGDLTLDSVPASGSFFDVGTTTVTVTATDTAGNASSTTFTITVNDTEAPAITSTSLDLTAENDPGECGAIVTYDAATATDNCGALTLDSVPASGSFFDVGTTTVTVTATDTAGNASSTTFTITVNDTEAPAITSTSADLTAENDLGECGAIVTYDAATATDNCPGVTLDSVPASGSFFEVGTTEVTVTATDVAGNTSTQTFSVTVNDTEAPEITSTSVDLTAENDLGECGAIVTYDAATATDNCGDLTLDSVPASGSFFEVGTTTVTVTATDTAGNASSTTFTITVNDTEAPAITSTSLDLTAENDLGECGAIVTYDAATATDNCPGVTLDSLPASGSFFEVGTTEVTVTATDVAGNQSTATFTITVNDTEAPAITSTSVDLTAENDLGECGAVVTYDAATATDNCPGVTLESLPASGSFFEVGTTEVTVTATDVAGNQSTATFTITVNDTEAPAITSTSLDLTAENDLGECGAIVTYDAATATDNCPGVTLDSLPASGSFFEVGTTEVTVTATDVAGNQSTATFTITVNDTEAPAITSTSLDLTAENDLGECGAIVTYDAATATDNCPGVTLDSLPASGSFFEIGTTEVTVTATDTAGNATSATFTITVNDTEAPAITSTSLDLTAENDLGECGAIVTYDAATATDNCPGVTLESLPASGSFFEVGTTEVTVTATDVAGNQSTATFTITVNDTEAPAITGTSVDLTAENDLGECGAIVTYDAATATDNCPGVTLDSLPASGSFFEIGTTEVTVTATDVAGNQSTATFTITVNDTEAPAITGTSVDLTAENDLGECGAIVTYDAATATDNCPGVTLESLPASGSFFEVGTTEVTVTATDVAGNQSTATFTITVNDTEAPAITSTSLDLTAENDLGECGAIVTYDAATATDNCPGVTLESLPASGSFFEIGTTEVTVTATDTAGNATSATFTITVNDTEAPAITSTSLDLTAENDLGECGAIVTYDAATATDNCPGVTLESLPASGSFFEVGTNEVTVTATDAAGNQSTSIFTITVTDDEAPTIANLPGGQFLENDLGECGAIVTWIEPSAADNCEVETFDSSHNSGDLFPVGNTVVSYTAVDVHGNEHSESFVITVIDSEAPVIVFAREDQSVENDFDECGAFVSWPEPRASDNCDLMSFTFDIASGEFFPIGDTLVTYTAIDIHENVSIASFTISVADTQAPAITGTPTDQLLTNDLGECGAVATWLEPAASDNCEIESFTADHASGELFPVGDTLVTYTALDIHGNTTTSSFTISVTDDEAPAITGTPVDMDLATDLGECGAVATWADVTADDNCEVATFSGDHLSGELFPVGDTLVTYTAVDIYGNSTTTSFTITVTDTEAPAITGTPADMDLLSDLGECGAVATWPEVTADDNCGIATFDGDHLSGELFPVGSTLVTYTATDDQGNLTTTSFTITVTDAEAPSITGTPADMLLTNDSGECGAVATWPEVTADDNCAVATFGADHTSGELFPVGDTLVTYTATDDQGNETTTSFTITVTDDEAPQILDLPSDLELTNDLGDCGAVVLWTEPTAEDNCGIESLTSSHLPGEFFAVGDTVVSYTTLDIHGNSTSASFTVTVLDTEAPAIVDVPADMLLSNDLDTCAAIVSWEEPGAFDNCEVASLTASALPGDTFPVGTTTVEYLAIDIHGNETTASFTITVEDTQAPELLGVPESFTVENDLGECGAIVSWTEPTSDDNCGIASLSSDVAPGANLPVGDTLVTYTTVDIHGNETTASFLITVLDTEAPEIVGLPESFSVENDLGDCGAIVSWLEPTATDNCAIASLTTDVASGTFLPEGDTLVTYTTVDIHGNETSGSFTVTVLDTEAPEILNLPADLTLTNDAGECGAVATWTTPDTADNCGIELLTSSANSGEFFEVGETTVTYVATDIHGNMTSASFTVTVTDDEAPEISGLPTDQLLVNDLGQCGALFDWAPPTADDNCGVASLVLVSPSTGGTLPLGAGPSGFFFPVGTTEVLYTATDIHGNEASASFLVTVEDTEAPQITDLPLDIDVNNDLGSCDAIVEWALPSAFDNCELASLTSDAASGDTFPVGQTIVTYTAVDIHSNSTTASFAITVTDNELPEILGLPADITLSNDEGACGAIVGWTAPTASDNCEVELLMSDRQPGEFFEVGTVTVTYTAVDIHGNQATGTFDVTVTDDELPTISGLPADLSLTNDEGECGALVSWTAPTAADNCEILEFTSTSTPGEFFPVGDTLVTYTATDIHGNSFDAGFTISVTDSEAPVIVDLRDDMLITNDPGECGGNATWLEPNVTDNCEIASLTSSHTSGDFFEVGSTVVTYTLIDIHGNSSTDSFTITVEDDELPTIAGLPTDMVLNSDPGLCTALVTWAEVTASDNCEVAQLTSDHVSGENYPVGTTLVTYAATDIHGNSTSASFTITVIDNEAPGLDGVSGDLVLTNDAGACGAIATWAAPTTSDNCAVADLTSTHGSGNFFDTGTTEVTYTVTDVNGNSTSASFTVTVTDDELPTITGLPANMVLAAEPGVCSAVAEWIAPSASDNCVVSEFESNHGSGKTFLLGTHDVIYTATDSSGNVSTATFTVTVIDTQAPELVSVPADLTMPNDAGLCGKLVAWAAPTATDNCEVATLTSSHQPGDFFPVGATTVTYTTTDPSGNTTSDTFTVTIEDTEAPAIAVAADQTHPAEEAVCFANVTVVGPTVGDNCAVATVTNDLTGTDDASGIYQLGTTTITWTVTDIHGHSTSATQEITITVDETDCNENGTPDVCDLASGFSIDCNENGIPDECEIDCNENGIPDDCDLANGTSIDTNSNEIPDECEPVFLRGDANSNGLVEFTDAIALLQYLTGSNLTPSCLDSADVNDDNTVNLADPIALLRHLFLNEPGPSAPYPGCGIDGDGISIGCDSYDACTN